MKYIIFAQYFETVIKKDKNPNIVILLPIFCGQKHDLKKGMSN